MNKILQNETIDKLPVAEIQATLQTFMEPVLMQMPEKRLQTVAELAVQGNTGRAISAGDANGARSDA